MKHCDEAGRGKEKNPVPKPSPRVGFFCSTGRLIYRLIVRLIFLFLKKKDEMESVHCAVCERKCAWFFLPFRNKAYPALTHSFDRSIDVCSCSHVKVGFGFPLSVCLHLFRPGWNRLRELVCLGRDHYHRGPGTQVRLGLEPTRKPKPKPKSDQCILLSNEAATCKRIVMRGGVRRTPTKRRHGLE